MKRLLKTTNIFQLRIGMGLGLKIERTETFIFSNDRAFSKYLWFTFNGNKERNNSESLCCNESITGQSQNIGMR